MLLFTIFAALAGRFAAAEGPKYADPQQVDADFALQGEYSGMVGGEGDRQTLGVQVIALGKGRFEAVGYFGGLPGDGWNGEKPLRAQGDVKDEEVRFQSERGLAKLSKGEIIACDPDGNEVGRLKKVVRESPTLGKKPPVGAVVLFDGTTDSLKNWEGGRMTEDGLLMEGTDQQAEVWRSLDPFRVSFGVPARGPRPGPQQQRDLPAGSLRSPDPRFVRPGGQGQRVRGTLLGQGPRA